MASQLHEEAVQEGKDKDQTESSFESGRNPFRLFSSQILGCIQAYGVADGGHGDYTQSFHPHSNGKACQGF